MGEEANNKKTMHGIQGYGGMAPEKKN